MVKKIAVSALIAPAGAAFAMITREQFGKFHRPASNMRGHPHGRNAVSDRMRSVSRKAACQAMMTKSDVDAELFGEPLPFAGRSTKWYRDEGHEVIDLLGVFELVPIHIFQL